MHSCHNLKSPYVPMDQLPLRLRSNCVIYRQPRPIVDHSVIVVHVLRHRYKAMINTV